MTIDRLLKLASRRNDPIEPLQEPGKRDTYLIKEVFKDTTFLTKQTSIKNDKKKQ